MLAADLGERRAPSGTNLEADPPNIPSLKVLLMKSAVLIATIGFLVAAPIRADAQLAGVHLNVAAGAAIPSGDLGSVTNVGFNVTGGLSLSEPGLPVGIRLEGMFNQFNVSDQAGFQFVNAGDQIRVWGGNANAVLNIPLSGMTTGTNLYAIGGIGFANVSETINQDSGNTGLAWNIGGGFRFPLTGFSAYVEARYHSLSTNGVNTTFTPIVFGLQF
jgi:hypothetical protein